MNDVGKCDIQGNIGILTINSPPVNALGLKVREALDAGFRYFAAEPDVRAIVLICAGRTFFAGADISEFDGPARGPGLHEVFDLIESSAKPVIAAIHATALQRCNRWRYDLDAHSSPPHCWKRLPLPASPSYRGKCVSSRVSAYIVGMDFV